MSSEQFSSSARASGGAAATSVPARASTPPDSEGPIDWVVRQFNRQIHDIEQRSDLSRDEKIDRIRNIACGACATIAIQPIPFADIFVLTPVQGYFGTRIAAIHGVPVTDSEAIDLAKEIVGLVGLGMIAQQLAIGFWKILTGGLGGLVTVPLVWTLTYGVMTVIDHYYRAKAEGKQLSKERMRAIFDRAREEAKTKRDSAGMQG